MPATNKLHTQRQYSQIITRVDPQMQHPNFTLISSNFENLHNYHHKSEIYHADLKLTVIVCSLRSSVLE